MKRSTARRSRVPTPSCPCPMAIASSSASIWCTKASFTPHLFRDEAGRFRRDVRAARLLRRCAIQPRTPLFIATGTGIAPFRSMTPGYLSHPHASQLTLLFGIRNEHTIYYRDDFEALARNHPNFRFWPTLSRADSSWTGRSGHVQSHLSRSPRWTDAISTSTSAA